MELKRDDANIWNRVTPFSRYMAMALFIALPFVGFFVGRQYAPVIEVPVSTPVISEHEVQESAYEDSTEAREVVEVVDAEAQSAILDVADPHTMIRKYESGSVFKVVASLENPFKPASDFYTKIIVVTTPGYNDMSCGGVYTPPICYIFSESQQGGKTSISYVGEWRSGIGSINVPSLIFKTPTTLEFTVDFGDAGEGGSELWNYNLAEATGTVLLTERSSAY